MNKTKEIEMIVSIGEGLGDVFSDYYKKKMEEFGDDITPDIIIKAVLISMTGLVGSILLSQQGAGLSRLKEQAEAATEFMSKSLQDSIEAFSKKRLSKH